MCYVLFAYQPLFNGLVTGIIIYVFDIRYAMNFATVFIFGYLKYIKNHSLVLVTLKLISMK